MDIEALQKWLLGATPMAREGSRPVDLAIVNADIFTCDRAMPKAEAVAIDDSRICYVGNDEGVADFVGPHTRVIDAQGNMLVPGFIDNHCHPLWIGGLGAVMRNNLYHDAKTLDELKAKMREFASDNPDIPFLIGLGWKPDYMPPEGPTVELGDEIIGDEDKRPLIMWEYSAEAAFVNTPAFKIMSRPENRQALERLDPYPSVENWNGLLRKFDPFDPLHFFDGLMSKKVKEKLWRDMLELGLKEVRKGVSCGVTGYHEVQVYRPFFENVIKPAHAAGLFKDFRLRYAYYISDQAGEDEIRQELEYWVRAREISDDHLIVGDSIKLYMDGTPAYHTSYMFEPFTDFDPEREEPKFERGFPLWSQERFDHVVKLADEMGIQCSTHCCGDAGLDIILNSYEKVKGSGIQHRIEHYELPLPAQVKRTAEIGVHAALQPAFHFISGEMLRHYGQERIDRFVPIKSLRDAGVSFSFGTDWSLVPFNPIYTLIAASTRLTDQYDWADGEQLPPEECIHAYTLSSARAIGKEKDLGSIEVGKLADFALFSVDLRKVDTFSFLFSSLFSSDQLDHFVMLTVVDGRIVYHKPGLKF